MSDSDLLFNDETPLAATPETTTSAAHNPWRVLIVDDEEQVHTVTNLVLRHFEFEGAKVDFVHAYSNREAQTILRDQPPFAMALIDVVMESDDAGLQLVRFIRETLDDQQVRLVLRTGQPGQAPEEHVISQYDINDYKNKTELTTTKLKTLMYSALRSYRDILMIDKSRIGLEKLINSISKIVDTHNLPVFASAVLEEIGLLLQLENKAVVARSLDAVAAQAHEKNHYDILAAIGGIRAWLEEHKELPQDIADYFNQARQAHSRLTTDDVYVGYYQTQHEADNLLFVRPKRTLNPFDTHLLDLFTSCVAITHDNLQQKEEIARTRRELVYVLGELVEQRNKEGTNHVRRVAQMSYQIAKHMGYDNTFCELIHLAAPLHDIGKIAVPDAVRLKTSEYTPEEYIASQIHTLVGQEMLQSSPRPMLKVAAIIAGQHHERWDGSGYPLGLKGEEIHVAARIVAIADVADSMTCDRPHRKGHSINEALEFIKAEAGKRFDPVMVNAFLEAADEFVHCKLAYPDPT